MSLSGSFSEYPLNVFGLYCTWSATQNTVANTSTVTLNVYLKHYSLYVGERSDGVVSINGVSETYHTPAISQSSNTPHTTLLTTKAITIQHNADGSKAGIPLSASWRFSGTYAGTSIGTITASTYIDLDKIDRTPPTVSFTVSNITSGGFTLSASSSAVCDIWQYSTDNGANWGSLSSVAGTSASKAVTGLSPNTSYNVKVRARKKSNQVYGVSGSTVVKTLGGTNVILVERVNADDETVEIRITATVYNAAYTHTLELKKGSTTILTVSGLSWSAGTATRTITLTSEQRTTLLTAMAQIKSFTGTFAVTTYNGSTRIGTASSSMATVRTLTAVSAPINNGFTFEDTNEATAEVTGNDQILIKNLSLLRVTPNIATPKNNATIAGYTVTCNGVSMSSDNASAMTLGKVTKAGNISIVLTVTDSRGFCTTSTREIEVIDHAPPRVPVISLRRENDVEEEIQLSFSGSFSPITVDSVQKNALETVLYRYKPTSSKSYGDPVSILPHVTVAGKNFSFGDLELCRLDANKSYDFELTISDRLTATTLNFIISQGTPLIALRKGRVGINTADPTAALHVSGEVIADNLTGQLDASNISGSIPVTQGGTGASTAAQARSNLGISVKRLYNGNLTTGSMSFNHTLYNAVIVIGQAHTSSGRTSIVIPCAAITSSAVSYQICDPSNYYRFDLSASGSTATIEFNARSSSGQILEVYGIN